MDTAAPRNGPSRVVALGALVAVIAGLYLAREILIPLALATLLSFLLAPLVERIEKIGLGRITAVAIATLLALVPIGLIIWIAGNELMNIAAELPRYSRRIREMLHRSEERRVGKECRSRWALYH